MAKGETIKTYSAADIERYHKGMLTSAEMHEMEKASLEDPFLADALEGYALKGMNISADIADLKKRFTEQSDQRVATVLVPEQKDRFNWWKVAAIVIISIGVSFLTYQLAFKSNKENIAQQKDISAAPTNNDNSSKTVAQEPINIPTAAADSFAVLDKSIATAPPANYTLDEKQASQAETIQDQRKKELVSNDKNPTAVPNNEIAKKDVAVDHPKQQSEVLVGYSDSPAKRAPVQASKSRTDSALGDVNSGIASRNAVATDKAKLSNYSNARIFRGKVTDQQNNALPFANITNPVDNVGTYADAGGNFTLTSPDTVLNVQIRSLGFENNAVALRSSTTDNRILMQEDRGLNAKILDTVRRNANRVRNSNVTLEEPEPADGWSNYDTYIANNLNIPENFKSRQSGTGEVELSFEVNRLGEPINIRVEKSLCETCDREAIRLIKEGPKWKRKARKNRTKVTVAF